MQLPGHGAGLLSPKAGTDARARSGMTPTPLKRVNLPSDNDEAFEGENHFYTRL
jgi:hypothetical protein